MIYIEIVEDILGFLKSQRSSSKDENWASYELHKLGNVEEIHEVQIEQNCIFMLMDLTFRVQSCLWRTQGPLNLTMHYFDFYFYLFEFLFI